MGEGQSMRGEGLQGPGRNAPDVVVGLSHGLLVQMSEEEAVHFTFFSFFFSFFLAFGEGALPLSTEEERRRPRVDLASRLTVHQLLLPELSFCTFTNLLCRERLCRTEFCEKEKEQRREKGRERERVEEGTEALSGGVMCIGCVFT